MAGFAERLEEVRRRVAAACGRAGRMPDAVAILPVSKTFGPEAVREAAESGITAFGESKVQEAAQKIPLCPGNLVWHMVGHLQRNKARAAVQLFDVIHSVDSPRVLEAIDGAAEEEGKTVGVFLEVNVSGEGSKFGLPPDNVPSLLAQTRTLMRVDVVGLMTMPPFTEDPEGARPFFVRLRSLRDEWRRATGVALDQLSMGMSRDFEVAVEEGATVVRLGTILFGQREKPWQPEGEE